MFDAIQTDDRIKVQDLTLPMLMEKLNTVLSLLHDRKGQLNEDHYEGKLRKAGTDRTKIGRISCRQNTLRIEYQAARLELTALMQYGRSVLEHHDAQGQRGERPRNLEALYGQEWQPSFEQVSILYNEYEQMLLHFKYASYELTSKFHLDSLRKLLDKCAPELEEDFSNGEGTLALERAYNDLRADRKTFIDSEETFLGPITYREFGNHFGTAHLSESPCQNLRGTAAEELISEIRTALFLRVTNGDQTCDERWRVAKSRLNELTYRRKFEELSLSEEPGALEERARLEWTQLERRADYAAAILQGLFSWQFIDQRTKWLRNRIDGSARLIAEMPAGFERECLMLNTVKALRTVERVEEERERHQNFSKIAEEPLSKLALQALQYLEKRAGVDIRSQRKQEFEAIANA